MKLPLVIKIEPHERHPDAVTITLDCKHETGLYFAKGYAPEIGSEYQCPTCLNKSILSKAADKEKE